ncbi:hypothetical protein LCGC14_0911860 [marine sediment metagenome]|uniref:NTP pyrophosphohydrolase MazG-like domain-containing protein n=1 Tax=marine sediment metagenome TaxID=412755 RepID=A0A0F9NT91_9ZZZZ
MYLETFGEYQRESANMDTGAPKNVPPLMYYALAVNEEAGELAGKVKKIYRDCDGFLTTADKDDMLAEGGDLLWCLTRFCEVLGISLGEMARRNLIKLDGRRERGTLQGSGDHR